MVLSDQRTPYNIMYVWAAFEAKSPPTRQDLVTLINNYTLYFFGINSVGLASLCSKNLQKCGHAMVLPSIIAKSVP